MKTIRQSFATQVVPAERPSPRGSPAARAMNPWLYGTIRSIEPSREMLFLRPLKDDKEWIVRWRPQTRFLCRGAEVKPDALHGGQQISVQFASDAGQKFAKEIDIVEPPAAETTPAQSRSK